MAVFVFLIVVCLLLFPKDTGDSTDFDKVLYLMQECN